MNAFRLPLLIIAFCLSAGAIVLPSTAHGQRRKPASAASRALAEITPRFVKESLLGESIDRWKFEPGEPLEVKILSKKFAAGKATAMVWINTNDVNGTDPFEGKVLLTFERSGSGGFLLLTVKENVNFGRKGAVASRGVPVRPTVPELRERVIASGTHHVKATGWLTWNFYLERSGQVTGRFTGEGGGVQGFIMSADEYVNWSNSNQYRTYYNSGVVSIGNIAVTLPPGDYRFVIYNANILTAKTATVSLLSN